MKLAAIVQQQRRNVHFFFCYAFRLCEHIAIQQDLQPVVNLDSFDQITHFVPNKAQK